MNRIWVTLITGFLGSGKTTLLNSLLRHPDMSDAAVIVNEFGEIGIDYDLVEQSDESVVQLANGCLCCSVKGDLIDTFRDLYIQRRAGTIPDFSRVIIETTGIADPGPVLQIILINPMVVNHYALDGVVTTVDAVNGVHSLDTFPECVKQVAIADRLILTKSDLVEGMDHDAKVDQVRTRLRALNPAAPVVETMGRDLDPDDLFGTGMFDAETKQVDLQSWLQPEVYAASGQGVETGESAGRTETSRAEAEAYYAEHGHSAQVSHNHDESIKSFCLVRYEPMSLDTLRLFLEGLSNEAGPDLLRVKGIVHVDERPDQPAVIQGAQQIFHSLDWLDSWPSDDKRTRIVFITRGIEQDYIEDAFNLIERISGRTAELRQRSGVRI